MSRKFPLFFAHHYLPELFFADPAGVVSDLFLEKKLAEAWKLGAEEMRELSLKDGAPRVKPLFWRNHRVLLVEFAPALETGESAGGFAVLEGGDQNGAAFLSRESRVGLGRDRFRQGANTSFSGGVAAR